MVAEGIVVENFFRESSADTKWCGRVLKIKRVGVLAAS
jgi:hypothetical protein